MKSINQSSRNLNNLPQKQTIKRINQVTKSFAKAGSNQRVRILQTLATEIDRTGNNAVRNWLTRFHTTLQSMEAAR